MSALVTAITYAADVLERVIGTDVLVSIAGLAVVVLFLYIEGGPRSHSSH